MKKIGLLMMSVVALTGCSNEDTTPVTMDGDVIRLQSSLVASGTVTRTPFIGDISSTNTFIALVPSSVADGVYDDDNRHTIRGTMTFKGEPSTAYDPTSLHGNTSEALFPLNLGLNAPFYLFGLHPAAGWTFAGDGTTVSRTFTGKEDVIAAEQISITKQEMRDIIALEGNGVYKALTFNHLLTKLEVKFNATPNALIEIGSIKKVELVSNANGEAELLPTEVTYSPTGTVEFNTTTNLAATMPFYVIEDGVHTDEPYTDKAYAPTEYNVLQAYCIAAPVTASDVANQYEYYLRITTENLSSKIIAIDLMNAGTDAGAFNRSTAGYSFDIIVGYAVDEVKVTATVKGWEKGGATTVPGI